MTMEVQGMIDEWLLEYVFKHRMRHAVLLLRNRLKEAGQGYTYRPIWAALYSLECMVEEGDVYMFDHAIQLTSVITDGALDLIPIKDFAKIVTGLKILSLFDMLKKGDDMVVPKLNEYFPREGFEHPRGDEKLCKKLTVGQRKFRKFFLPLIANMEERENYIENDLDQEFGADFLDKLKDLVKDFINVIKKVLPETMIEKLMKMDQSSMNWHNLSNCTDVHLQLLLDCLQGRECLSEHDILEYVEATNPASTTLAAARRKRASSHLVHVLSDDTEDATRSQKRMESSSSVESITPKRFYRKSSNESTPTSERKRKLQEKDESPESSVESITPKRFYRKSSNESTPTSGRKRKLQEKDASPVRVKRKTKKKAEPISPDLISDHEEEKENEKKDRKKQEGDGNLEASEEVSNSLKARRESDEMVAPSPHSTLVMSQRMRKGVQRKTKTVVTPREKNVASSGYQDTPVTRNNNEKKKQSSGNRVEETEGNSSETPTDDSIEELLTPSRRRKKITPSVYNTKNRKELHEDTDSATPVMEEITVRSSPRSGSVDTEKAGSSEGSSSLLRKVHAKKIKELQSGSESADKEERREQKIDENLLAKQQVCAEDTNKNKNETDSNETKNSAIDQFSPSYEMSQEQRRDVNPGPSTRIKPVKERSGIDRDRGSPAPSPRTKKLKEDAGQSPVRTSPRIRGRESANSLESNKVSNEARKQNENVGKTSTRSDISATEAKESKYGDAQLNDQYDNNSSEDDEELEIIMEIDADFASDESEDHYMDASDDQEDEDEFVDASEEMPPSDNMKVNASVEPKPEIIVISGSSGKPQNQEQQVEKTEEVKIPTVRRSKRSNGATPKNEERTTDEQYLEDDSEEAVGPTQEIRRVMGDLTESPQKKPKKSINDSEKLSRRKNTNVENKAKESPLIASLNNRERVESGEDNETPVLRRTRRILKDSPLLKEIHNEEGDFASPMGSKRRDDTPRAVVTGKVITAENTLKESPQFARFRNRRRIESSDEESAAEETPGTIRLKKGIAQSNQVKEIDGENTNSKISDDETPVLRRTRRLHKDSPLLKEINSTAGDFVSPHSDKKRKVAPNVSTAKVIAKKDTPKEPPQIARLRNRKIIESSDDESGAEVTPVAARRKTVGKNRETKETEENDETPVLRRTRRMHKESPLAKEIDHTDDDCLIPTGSRQRHDALKTKSTSRVTAPDDTPKESPQFARLRNRRRIESSDEESATEETPRATRRMGLLESPLVKELNDKNIGTNKTPKGTSGLRATRGSARKGTPEKGINDQGKGGKDKQARPNINMTENLEPATSNGKLTRTTENGHEKQSVEEEEDNENDVQAASNELSGSDESLEQFQTPSKKIDKEVTLNYKAMSPIKIDKEITLNVGRDSPRSKISQSSLQNSNRKVITPKRSPCKAGSARKQKEVSDRSPARQEGRAETPRSPPRHKHSELEDLWEHTPKGQYGRWKKPGQILYKVPSPPSVSRVVETEVVPSVADRFFPASDTPPCATSATKRGNVGSHQGPIELFAKSPRILRASRASPSPSKAAKDKAPEIDSPKVTPRSTRKTRQTSGTPGNEKNAEGRNLRSPAIKTPKNKSEKQRDSSYGSSKSHGEEIPSTKQWTTYRSFIDLTQDSDDADRGDDVQVVPSSTDDSDIEEQIPSSYSFNRYESIIGTVRHILPPIDWHYIPVIKPCIVKLHQQVFNIVHPRTGKNEKLLFTSKQTTFGSIM